MNKLVLLLTADFKDCLHGGTVGELSVWRKD